MVMLRRLFLIVLVLVVPVILTGALYEGTLYLLHATNRTIAPEVINYSAVGEYIVFLFLMFLDAKNRW